MSSQVVRVRLTTDPTGIPPDQLTIGRELDRILRDRFTGQVAVRLVSASAHEGRTVDELIRIVTGLGTDLYDPGSGEGRNNVYAPYAVEFEALPCTVTGQAITSPDTDDRPETAGTVLELAGSGERPPDLVLVYDLAQLERVVHDSGLLAGHRQETDPARPPQFRFRDPESKPHALRGVIVVERPRTLANRPRTYLDHEESAFPTSPRPEESRVNLHQLPKGVDPSKPSPARIYDYLLGGTENLEIDRTTAENLLRVEPDLRDLVWANRGFLQRATSWLARAGIDQFIDIGAGLPTKNNTHDAARRIIPDAKVVYVDNDPMAVTHGRALIGDVAGPESTAYISGEFRDPERIMGDPELRALVDLDRPVGILLVALMHFIPDSEDPVGLIHRYLDMVPSGSYVVISHATTDHRAPDRVEEAKRVYSAASSTMSMRTRAEFTAFFEGLEVVPPYAGAKPDVTYVSLWGAEDPDLADSEGARIAYCAVARKP